jgi:circadian clock protein KaiC
VAKSRVTPHEASIREFKLSSSGILVGEPLADFEGILTGAPAYHGGTALIATEG